MLPPGKELLGLMKPIGGGDPVPLRKTEMVVGRRASCDIVLDFENISGKHCELKYYNQVWHVRDMGSTNGTTVNNARLSSEHTVLPDDELGFAGHVYHIEYEPGAPETILNRDGVMEDDITETRKRTSLMELAGLDTDDVKAGPRQRRATKAPEVIQRLSAEEGEFDDALPEHVKAKPKPKVEANDDDFLKLIEEDVKTDKKMSDDKTK
jgi:pSer/pThr/pTyr-binding forkhead associated (FHA) protein